MLRPRVDCVPVESGFQTKTFRYAQCAAGALAVIAVAISTFDLTNVAVVDAATKFIDRNARSIAAWPERLQSEVGRVSHRAWQSVVTAVPDDEEDESVSTPVKLASVDPSAPVLRDLTPEPTTSLLHARLPSPADLLHLTGATLPRARQCLARAIYFEARNEPLRGQIAVAQVVLNRVFSGFYPGDLCDVVYQNANRHLDCQFTFACDGRSKVIHESGAWARAEKIAAQVLAGDVYDTAVGTSTHYHALYVRPDWVPEMKKHVRYGTHNFYRPAAWGSGEDAPVWGVVPLPPHKSAAQE